MEIDVSGFNPSENYLCVATLLELIVNSFGYEPNRYDIANYFGVNLPSGVIIEKIDNYHVINDVNYLGIVLTMDSVNRLFRHFNINLSENFISINTIPEEMFTNRVKELLPKSHIICGFDYGTVYDEKRNIGVGHVSIITNVNDERVTIFDPGPRNSGIKVIDVDRLYYGIKRKREGLWCIHNLKGGKS